MPRKKAKRLGIKLDMTPFVDIAFLLLTFFMLTTQFRPPQEIEIELPSSHSAFKLPESDVLTINVSKTGEIFMSVDSQILMGKLFGEENRLRAAVQVDEGNLGNLIIQARIANPRLRTVIKGDKNAPYGVVEDVMNILQKAKVTRFNLVTDLESS
jgi:biopolymer transport protein ExbD